MQFIERLRIEISKYSMLNYPSIEMLKEKQLTKEELKEVLLNFRPLVARFTDVLLKFAGLTCQGSDRVAEGAKMHSRFLMTLNILDELGFSPDVDHEGYYQGSSFNSHYLLFEKVLEQVGIDDKEKQQFIPCEATDAMTDLLEIAVSLVATEMVALHFSPALRKNAEILESLNLDSGYFYVHGSSEDENTNAADDDHEDNLWHVIAQKLSPKQYKHFESKTILVMQKYLNWCDAQLPLASTKSTSHYFGETVLAAA